MRISKAVLIICSLAVTRLTSAQLSIGAKAPVIQAAGFVKGDKFGSLEKGKTYVIEFWATWCGPCIASMPRHSEMTDQDQERINQSVAPTHSKPNPH